MEDREIPDERIRNPDAPVVPDSTLGTPFSRLPPLLLWRGEKHAILQLPNVGSPVWILYSYANPTQFEKLTFKKEDLYNNYKFFHYFMGKEKKERFLKVKKDQLLWDYYIDGHFVFMDEGQWVDVDATKKLTKNQLVLIGEEEGSATERYKRNPFTGIVNIFPTGEENDKPVIIPPKTPYELLLQEIQHYRVKKQVDAWNKTAYTTMTEDSRAYGEGETLLEKINGLQEVKDIKEAVMKKAWGQMPLITEPLPQYAWADLCKAYKIETETLFDDKKNTEIISALTYEESDQLGFIEIFLLPELHLYPKCFFMFLEDVSIYLCGTIKKDGQVLSNFTDRDRLYINAKKKSVFKVQQAFHQYLGEKLVQAFQMNIPKFEGVWKSLNQSDFVYDEKLQAAPEGVHGFLTFGSLLSYSNDVRETWFALMKDPKTVLEHSDPIVAKKAQFLKDVINTLLPKSFDEEWWKKVQDYKDMWELSTGTTEHFKEVNLKNFNSPGKKKDKMGKE